MNKDIYTEDRKRYIWNISMFIISFTVPAKESLSYKRKPLLQKKASPTSVGGDEFCVF